MVGKTVTNSRDAYVLTIENIGVGGRTWYIAGHSDIAFNVATMAMLMVVNVRLRKRNSCGCSRQGYGGDLHFGIIELY